MFYNIIQTTSPDKQVKVLSNGVWILFSLELLCVFLFFINLFYGVAKKLGMNGLKYVYVNVFIMGVFIVLNIIGLFVYSQEVKEYKKLNQKSPSLLNILRLFSIIVSVIGSVPLFLFLISV